MGYILFERHKSPKVQEKYTASDQQQDAKVYGRARAAQQAGLDPLMVCKASPLGRQNLF